MAGSGGFEEFLERVRTGNHPAYGLLTWDGETGQVIMAIHFELNKSEPAEVVNARAWSFLRKLTPAEWLALEIEITLRDHKAVRAVLKPRSSVVKIGTARLKALVENP